MFRRKPRDPEGPPRAPAEVFEGLRGQLFGLDPAEAGLTPDGVGAPIWGGMMELGLDGGVASLVCLADGTTSMYTSTGGGMIGGGAHPAIVHANSAFLRVLAEHLGDLEVTEDVTLPAPGRVILRAFGFHHRLAVEAAEADLGHRRVAVAPVFHAGHDVLTQLRLLQQSAPEQP